MPRTRRARWSPVLLAFLPILSCADEGAERTEQREEPAVRRTPDEADAPGRGVAHWSKAPRPTDKALAALVDFLVERRVEAAGPGWRTHLPKPPKVEFDLSKRYLWDLRTNQGALRVEFFPRVAPMHVSSTAYLTLLGFYDGLTFHRVISDFMAQGGDPHGDGSGDPGYAFDGEFDLNTAHDRRGVLSTANRGRGTDGSQFFLTFVPRPDLDGRHTVFGYVVEGKDTTLSAVERLAGKGEAGTPRKRVVIEQATVSVE